MPEQLLDSAPHNVDERRRNLSDDMDFAIAQDRLVVQLDEARLRRAEIAIEADRIVVVEVRVANLNEPALRSAGDMVGSQNSLLLKSQNVSSLWFAKNNKGPCSNAGKENRDTSSRNNGGNGRPRRSCNRCIRSRLSVLTIRHAVWSPGI